MMISRYGTRSAFALLAGPVLLYAMGCSGDDGLGKRYAVSGKVTHNGQPVAKGVISFIPEKGDGHGAQGQIENGSYTLGTLSPGDGAFPGSYKVVVNTRDADASKAKEAAVAEGKKHGVEGGYSQVPQEIAAKLRREAKSTTPTKYEDPAGSGLTATVAESSNTINFDLKD
jgi:hypothetical protein